MSELKKLFNRINDNEKSNFLWEILQNEQGVRKKFMERFIQLWEEIRLNEPPVYDIQNLLDQIKEEAGIISAELNDLDFEDLDWELYDEPGYYVPDYQAAQMVAENMADQAVEGLMENMKKEIEFDDLTRIVLDLASTLHGIDTAELYDPNCNLSEDPEEYFLDKLKTLLEEEKNRLISRKFLSTDFNMALELFFRFHQGENCKTHYFSIFADLFHSVIQDQERAQIFWDKADFYGFSLSEHPTLLNHVVGLLGDKQLWVKTMEDIFLQDYQASEDLMAYYFETNLELFEAKAASFFEKYNSDSYNFLVKRVEKGSFIHIIILKYATINMMIINAFIELKKFTTSAIATDIIESITDPGYKIELWNLEKRYDKIEIIITDELKHGAYIDSVNFRKSITYLYETKPDAAINLTEQKIKLLMSASKNRNTYRYIADILKQSLSIKGKQEIVKTIALGLYHHKPNLPALKDELRKADLI